MSQLPAGFVIDKPKPVAQAPLPAGFVLDAPAAPAQPGNGFPKTGNDFPQGPQTGAYQSPMGPTPAPSGSLAGMGLQPQTADEGLADVLARTEQRWGEEKAARGDPVAVEQPGRSIAESAVSAGKHFVGGVERGAVETMAAGYKSILRNDPHLQGPYFSSGQDAERAGLMGSGGRGAPRSATQADKREESYAEDDALNINRQILHNYFDNALADATRAGTIAFEAEKAVEILPPESPAVAAGKSIGRAAKRIVFGPDPKKGKLLRAEAASRAKKNEEWQKKWYEAGSPPLDQWLKSPEGKAAIGIQPGTTTSRENADFDDWLAAGSPDDVAVWYNSKEAKAKRTTRQAPEGYKPSFRLRSEGQARADAMNAGVQQLVAEHPFWQTPQVNTARELMMNPDALAGQAGAMVPYMAAFMAATLVGQPQLGFVVGVAVEGDEAYQSVKAETQAHIDQLIAAGQMQEASELQANMEGNAMATFAIAGTAKAYVEQAQLSGMIQIGKAAAKGILGRNLRRLAKARILLGMHAKKAFDEATQEATQGAIQDVTSGVIAGTEIDPDKFVDQRLIEGVLGAVVYGPGAVTSTGFHYLKQSKAETQLRQQQARAKSDEQKKWTDLERAGKLSLAEAQVGEQVGAQRAAQQGEIDAAQQQSVLARQQRAAEPAQKPVTPAPQPVSAPIAENRPVEPSKPGKAGDTPAKPPATPPAVAEAAKGALTFQERLQADLAAVQDVPRLTPENQEKYKAEIAPLERRAKALGERVRKGKQKFNATKADAALLQITRKINAIYKARLGEQEAQPAAVAKPATTAEPAAKEPWQFVRKEYAIAKAQAVSRGPMQKFYSGEEQKLYRQHARLVKKAVKEGRDVPAEVLADYPEIAKVAKPAPPAKAGEPEGFDKIAANMKKAREEAQAEIDRRKAEAKPAAEGAKGDFADNKVFTQADEDAADAVINEARKAARKPKPRRGGFAAIPDPNVLKAYVTKGLVRAEAIIRKLGKLTRRAWTAAMKADNPDLKPADLRKVWGVMRRDNRARLTDIEKAVAKAATVAARPSKVKAQVKDTLTPTEPGAEDILPADIAAGAVPPSADVTEQFEGEEGPKRASSKTAEWIDALAVEEGLHDQAGDIELRQHDVMDMKEQARMVAALPYEQAERIALGQETPPAGLRVGSAFVAVGKNAVMTGKYDLVMKLATSEALDAATRAGQEVKAFDARDPLDPVRAIRNIIKVSKEAAERRHGKVNPKVIAELEGKLDTANKALAEAIAQVEQTERENAMMKADRELSRKQTDKPERAKRQRIDTSKNKIFTDAGWDSMAADLMADLRGVHSIAHVPALLAKTVKTLTYGAGRFMEAGGRSATDWAKMMVEKFGPDIKPALQKAWNAAKKEAAKAKRAEAGEKIRAGLAEDKPLSAMQSDIRDMYRNAIDDGVKGVEARLDAVLAEVQELDPDMTREDVRDAISGYGKVIIPNQDAIEIELRDNMAQHRELAKLRDMAEGKAPLATGMQRDTPSDDTRELTKQVNEKKKEGGYAITNAARQLKTALGAIRTRLRNEIADLNKQIAEGKRSHKNKTKVEYTAELKALKLTRDARRAVLNALDPKAPLTDKQRIDRALKHYDRRMTQLQDKLACGDYATPKKTTWRDAPMSPEKSEALRRQRRADALARKLHSLAGMQITREHVKNLVDLSKKAAEAKDAMEEGPRRQIDEGKGTPTELASGLAEGAFHHYVSDLKTQGDGWTWERIKQHPIEATVTTLQTALRVSISMISAWDNSFIGRQGIKTLFISDMMDIVELPKRFRSHSGPRFIWSKTFLRSWKILWDTFGGRAVMDTLHAEALSDPQHENHLEQKLDLNTAEEAFPGHLRSVDRIVKWATKREGSLPRRLARQAAGFGFTSYKASENMFTGSAQYMRRMLANKEVAIVLKSGGVVDKPRNQGIGNLVNSQTARGHMGENPIVSAFFWAPRMIIGNFDTLTFHSLDLARFRHPENQLDRHARFRSAVQLVQIVTGMAGVLGLAGFIDPDSIEWDPASADFGKIKIGSTRFDVTGGMGSLVVLVYRLWFGRSKSSSTGKVTRLNTKGFRGRNYFDVGIDFITNKVTPPIGELIQHAKGEDRNAPRIKGKPVKPTVLGSAVNLVTPFAGKTAKELLQDPEAADFVGAMIADGMGISTNTYPDILPHEAGNLLTAVDVYEHIVREAKDAEKPVEMSITAKGKRLTRAKTLIWDTQNEWEDKGGDKKRMFRKTAAIAKAALSDKLIFGKFAPAGKKELRFAYSELHHANAEAAMTRPLMVTGATQTGTDKYRAAAKARTGGAKAKLDAWAREHGSMTPKERKAFVNSALGSVRSTYSRNLSVALEAGDIEAASAYYKARLALGVTPADIRKRMDAKLKSALSAAIARAKK